MTLVSSNLAVGFVTPAFAVAGIFLASIPIIIHILNRRRFKIVDWAAMDFLLRAMRKNRRRLRFEQWLLLAMRCLVLAFLGLALARPISCNDNSLAAMAAQRTGLHVLVIDNSGSMAYEVDRGENRTHLEQAKSLAKEWIDRLSAGGESVAIVTAARPATAILAKPGYDLEAARSAVDRIAQSAGDTDLPGALQLATQIATQETRQPVKVLTIFTDATRSAFEGSAATSLKQLGPELSRTFARITHFNVGRPNQWNQAALSVDPGSRLVVRRFGTDFAALLRGYGPESSATLQWKLDGNPLPGGGSIQLDLQTPPQTQSQAVLKTGGPHVISAGVIGDDHLKADNTRWRTFDVASELQVLIVEGERGAGALSGSGAFLQLALAPPAAAGEQNAARTDSYVAPDLISDLELGNKVLADYSAVILTSVGQIQSSTADQLQKFVEQGGTLLIFMGESVTAENYNTTLLPRKLLPGPLAKRVSVSDEQKGFVFDFNPKGVLHPMLGAFRGEEKSGLDTAQVFTYWQIDLSPDTHAERVLNYRPQDGGSASNAADNTTGPASDTAKPSPETRSADPAITVHTLGRGRVVFVSTTANADWTSLPAKPTYVSLMHELLAGSLNSSDGWMNLLVGQSLEIPAGVKMTAAPTLTDANRKPINLEQTTRDGQTVYRSPPLQQPGVYNLSTGSRTYPISVNVPADESDIRTLDNAAVKRALGDIDLQLEGDQMPAIAAVKSEVNDFGWTFMAIVLLLVAGECFLAMRFGHFRKS